MLLHTLFVFIGSQKSSSVLAPCIDPSNHMWANKRMKWFKYKSSMYVHVHVDYTTVNWVQIFTRACTDVSYVHVHVYEIVHHSIFIILSLQHAAPLLHSVIMTFKYHYNIH